jgi:hypothetical protein
MPLFLISYSLLKPEEDYPELIRTLRNIGARRVLRSGWLINSSLKIGDVFDRVWIGGNLGCRDKLLVTQAADITSSENINMDDLGLAHHG